LKTAAAMRAGRKFSAAEAADIIERLIEERDILRKLDMGASRVESIICLRTGFTGEPPYTGWEGLAKALSEALDERDRLKGLHDKT